VLREGVAAGEQVAASGSFKLRDSVLVAVIQKPESVAANAAPAGKADVAL
jgi:membrane fusion protein, multidrug efflux system